MREPIIVLNVGWMKYYKGLEGDELTDGGAFPREHGWGCEILNFLPFEGYMYGCVQPPGKKEVPYNSRIIAIERLGATRNDLFVDGVLVGWVARKPEGGTYVVGWYRNATVFRKWQNPPQGSRREYGDETLGYYVRARANDCILLTPDERTLRVPRARDPENLGKGGIGQANVWYADSGKPNDLKFGQEFKRVIQSYDPH